MSAPYPENNQYPAGGGYPPPAAGGYPPPAAGGYPPPTMGGYPAAGGYPPPAGGGYPAQAQPGYVPSSQVQPNYAPSAPPAPMSYTPGVPFGELQPVRKLFVKQKFSALEAVTNAVGCGCCEQRNKYDIFNAETGEKLYRATEVSEWYWRCCCNPCHPLQMKLETADERQFAMIDRPFRAGCCFTWFDCCREEAILYPGNFNLDKEPIEMEGKQPTAMGRVRQPICGGGCVPVVNIYNAENINNDENPAGRVEGPLCCFGGCTELCCDQTFKVKQGEADIGKIVKERPKDAKGALAEVVQDADLFSLTYEKEMTLEEKANLLAALLLVDYMFFEEGGMCSVDPIDQSLTINCFNCYVCGCFCPCSVTLSSGN